jgi:hypothetical protein
VLEVLGEHLDDLVEVVGVARLDRCGDPGV